MIKAIFANGYELVVEEIHEEYFQNSLRIVPVDDNTDLDGLVANISDGMSEIRVYEDGEHLVTFTGYTEIFDITRSVTTQSFDGKAYVAVMVVSKKPTEIAE